jgi:hypothetical protein
MIPVNRPKLGGNELRYFTDCIETGRISFEAPFVKSLESKFARIARLGLYLQSVVVGKTREEVEKSANALGEVLE